MSNIKLAGAAWSWVGATLKEQANIWRALGINALELISVVGADLEPSDLESDLEGRAKYVMALGMDLSSMLYVFGKDFYDRATNSPDKAVQAKNQESFKGAIEFCTAAGIPSIIILPGMDQEGMTHQDAMKLSADSMSGLTAIGREAGIKVLFEPHLQSVFESPLETLTVLQEYQDLEIVLDHSHFMAANFEQKDIDPLIPYAGHVHLRQGALGQLQAKWEESEIEYMPVIRKLKEIGYEGYLTFEYENDPWLPLVDVMTETIKLRDAILPLL